MRHRKNKEIHEPTTNMENNMNTENNPTEDTINPRPKRRGGKGRPSHKGRGRRGEGPRGEGRRERHGKPGGRHKPGGSSKGGRRKRPLAHGDLRLLILNIIKTKPSHGYGLITEIKNLTSGIYEPSPGVIYPALEALQDLEWITAQADEGKRVLSITETGLAQLDQEKEALVVIEQRLQRLATRQDATDTDDVRGALRQLKHTTVSIFKETKTDIETRKAAVAILEDARQKIAKLK